MEQPRSLPYVSDGPSIVCSAPTPASPPTIDCPKNQATRAYDVACARLRRPQVLLYRASEQTNEGLDYALANRKRWKSLPSDKLDAEILAVEAKIRLSNRLLARATVYLNEFEAAKEGEMHDISLENLSMACA